MSDTVKPSAYLKQWINAEEQHCCRVDLTEVCEPWLHAYGPAITPLYTLAEARTPPTQVGDDVVDLVRRMVAGFKPFDGKSYNELAREIIDTVTATRSGYDERLREALHDANWLNAATCIENVEIAIEDESLSDEDGPVDTVVSSGDLFVLLSLAKAASRAHAALSAHQEDGSGA